MEDKELICVDCNKPFIWTVSEQKFYQEKGFDNQPKRDKGCRALKKQRMEERNGGRY